MSKLDHALAGMLGVGIQQVNGREVVDVQRLLAINRDTNHSEF